LSFSLIAVAHEVIDGVHEATNSIITLIIN